MPSVESNPTARGAASAKSGADAEALSKGLRAAIAGEVRFDSLSRTLYSTDASIYEIIPLGVVLPRNVEDVSAAIRVCRDAGA